MEPESRPLSARLSELLAQTFLREVRGFETLDSTNTHALQLLSQTNPLQLPLLVQTDSQHAGRGRGSHLWWSSPGGLTFSLAIDASEAGLAIERIPLMSLLTGIAVVEVCQTQFPRADFALKWPNDVYLNSKKLAGILIETIPSQPHLLVIGIGLNVNNSFIDAPDELRETGISLSDAAGRTFDSLQLLEQFLLRLEDLLVELVRGDNPVVQRWSGLCLLTGQHVVVNSGPVTIAGTCLGIDERGALIVRSDGGEQRLFGGTVESWGFA